MSNYGGPETIMLQNCPLSTFSGAVLTRFQTHSDLVKNMTESHKVEGNALTSFSARMAQREVFMAQRPDCRLQKNKLFLCERHAEDPNRINLAQCILFTLQNLVLLTFISHLFFLTESQEISKLKISILKGTWLGQLVDHVTLELRVVGVSPMQGIEIT